MTVSMSLHVKPHWKQLQCHVIRNGLQCMCVCACVRVCAYTCVCVCVCVYVLLELQCHDGFNAITCKTSLEVITMA